MIQASFSINPPAPAMHQLFFFLLRLLDSIARVRAENRTSKRKKGKKKKREIRKKKKKNYNTKTLPESQAMVTDKR